MYINHVYKALKYLIPGGGITKILSLVTIYFIIKGIGIYNFGEYTIALAAISICGIFYRVISGQLYQIELSRLLGLKEYSSAQNLTKELLYIITGITLFLITLVYGIIFSLDEIIFKIDFKKYHSLILISSIYVITLGYKNILVSINRSFGYFKELSYWNIAEYFCKFFLIFTTFSILKISITVAQIVLIDLISLIIGCVTYKIFFYKKIIFQQNQKKGKDVSLFQIIKDQGTWFFLRLLIVDLTTNTRIWIITFLLSVEAVGFYGVFKRVVQSAKILLPLGVIFNTFLPKNSFNKTNFRTMFIQCLNISWMLGLIAVILLFLGTIIIIPHVFPEMGTTLQFLIFIGSGMYLFKTWTYSFVSILGLDRKYKNLFLVNFFLYILTLIFLPIFIKIAGIYGMAFDLLFNSMISFLLTYYFLIKERPSFSVTFDDIKEIIQIKSLKQLKLFFRR